MVLLVACGAFGMLAGWILADRDQEALRAEDQTRRAETEAKLARNAQARALQAQMNPHVLYNTLSGLAELARQDGKSLQSVIDRAIETYRRQRFLEGLHNDFAALRNDPDAWQAEKEERAAWDAALADGEKS